jgi:hypothetical protein
MLDTDGVFRSEPTIPAWSHRRGKLAKPGLLRQHKLPPKCSILLFAVPPSYLLFSEEKKKRRPDARRCNTSCARATMCAGIIYVLGKFECPNDRFLAFEGTEIHVTDK